MEIGVNDSKGRNSGVECDKLESWKVCDGLVMSLYSLFRCCKGVEKVYLVLGARRYEILLGCYTVPSWSSGTIRVKVCLYITGKGMMIILWALKYFKIVLFFT